MFRIRIALVVALLCAWSSQPVFAEEAGQKEYDEAVVLREKGEYPAMVAKLRAAAAKGHGEAMARLGTCYVHGFGVERNAQTGFEWFRKSAEAGDLSGMFSLGHAYLEGMGTDSDLEAGRRWLLAAAEKGYAPAMVAMARVYVTGTGVKRDFATAVDWYRRAADAGNEFAMNSMGEAYERGIGVDADPAKAREWYTKAADAGSAGAMANLGRIHGQGIGVEADPVVGFVWMKRAAEEGLPEAMWRLVSLYASGEGTTKSTVEVARWTRRAASAGHPEAMLAVGLAYWKGGGAFERSRSKAIRWLRRAGEAGSVHALYSAGYLLVYEPEDEKERTEGIRLLERADEKGHATAAYTLSLVFGPAAKDEDEDWKTSFRWMKRAAEAGHVEAMNALSKYYARGIGVPKDAAKAAEWRKRAKAAGYEGDEEEEKAGPQPAVDTVESLYKRMVDDDLAVRRKALDALFAMDLDALDAVLYRRYDPRVEPDAECRHKVMKILGKFAAGAKDRDVIHDAARYLGLGLEDPVAMVRVRAAGELARLSVPAGLLYLMPYLSDLRLDELPKDKDKRAALELEYNAVRRALLRVANRTTSDAKKTVLIEAARDDREEITAWFDEAEGIKRRLEAIKDIAAIEDIDPRWQLRYTLQDLVGAAPDVIAIATYRMLRDKLRAQGTEAIAKDPWWKVFPILDDAALDAEEVKGAKRVREAVRTWWKEIRKK